MRSYYKPCKIERFSAVWPWKMVSVCWFPNRFENNLAPEEGFFIPWRKVEQGLFSNRNIGRLFKYIYFLLYSFVYFFIRPRRKDQLPFHIFLQVQLHWSRSTTRRSNITHWFVAVALLTFYIFWYLPGGKANRLNRRGSEPRSKPSI